MIKSVLILSVFMSIAYTFNLNIKVDQPAHEMSPQLYGIFVEEINHGLDGGLHAELIKNRALNPKGWNNLEGYDVVSSGAATGGISISYDNPLNGVLKTSLRLQVNTRLESGERVGILNTGHWGIPIRPDYTSYNASFYAKTTTNYAGPLTVSIESTNGSIIYASAIIPAITSVFQKYEVILRPTPALIQNPTLDVVFVIAVDDNTTVNAGTEIYFQLISLYPPTWRNKRNGLRIDIAEKLAAAKPSIMRFPGGSFLEGFVLEGEILRYVWEETIGPIEDRPGHPGLWDYYASNGIGMLEYLELAEELNATAVMGVYAGRSLSNFSYPPGEMGPFIQSALNAIEYAIGDVNTTWGSIRAANGHPDPFPLPYVEIGNEDYFSVDYEIRYPLFYDAITAKFPQITIIGTTNVESRPVPVRDDHYFVGLGGFSDLHNHYDDMPRNGSKVYIGEYATRDGDATFNGSLVIAHVAAAMDDASFLTSVERNSDLIIMTSYAPLLCNVNNMRWTPNAIYFDGLSSYATPAWWVQHLFSTIRGNIFIPNNCDGPRETFFHSASINTATNTLIVRAINSGENEENVDVHLIGICRTLGGKVTVLTGGRFDSNTLEEPMKISPKEATFSTTTSTFSYIAPANSLYIFELQLVNDSCETTTISAISTTTAAAASSGYSSLQNHQFYSLYIFVYTLLFISATT